MGAARLFGLRFRRRGHSGAGDVTAKTLTLFPLADSDVLIAGDLSSKGANIRSSSTLRGETLVYTIEHNNPVMLPFDDAWSWNLGLTTQIPLELDGSIGVGSMGLTFDKMMLEHLNISQGVGEVEIILPDGDYRAEIDQAIGQILVEIPQGVPIRFGVSKGISGLSLPSDFEKYNDYYYSPGARGMDDFIHIEINQAIGNIIVRYER